MKLKVKDLQYGVVDLNILNGIDAVVDNGEFVGMIGPNGCGKSTMLKCVYRALTPDGGDIELDGRSIRAFSNRELAREMSVMIQENHVEFDMTVMDMVLLGRYAHKKVFSGTDQNDREIAREALSKVGMLEYEERSFLHLSGGEKQRILIARALAQKANFIVLDEPTNHLDIKYQYQIMNVLTKEDVTVFSSVHDLNIAAQYCDKIILLYKGKVVDYGTPEDVITEQNIRDYFGVNAQVTINPITKKVQVYYLP
ncbi:MAG: ABC transporter ATP-binding protein [Fusicatenibacter sp.]|nr:ABC transporter ATP-binding protein [Lachnospiraceae bacterium]MDY2936719.1 ABC transporter ATP-binding protein [Fusicatenibacter sp.]